MIRFLLAVLFALPASAANPETSAATSVNAFGLDYLRLQDPAQNGVFSPYSIQLALGMTSAGAAGETLAQMRRTLHHYADTDMNTAFAKLSARITPPAGKDGLMLETANRLYAQQDIPFRPAFLETIRAYYGAPVEQLDFSQNKAAAKTINTWVATRTRQRIRDLVPATALDSLTRLVLVNAVYFKASWAQPFHKNATQPRDFHLANGTTVESPAMTQTGEMRRLEGRDFTAVGLPYAGGELQFLILLPAKPDGLADLEKNLTPTDLAACAKAPLQRVQIQLPRFRLEPPAAKLNDTLIALGMPFAFDQPRGIADFSDMAGKRDLFISNVFHKAFVAVDEAGTEAAAATAVVMSVRGRPPAAATEVRVDRPFLFAIQHTPTGACLFLGRVTDPR